MKDNEIVKALEDAMRMGDAPIGKYWGCMISKLTAKEAVDLINRQKKEIEAWKHYYNECLTDLKNAHVEIERLNKIAEQRKKAYFSKVAECIEIRKTAKSEAYKEFMEKVRQELYKEYEKIPYTNLTDLTECDKAKIETLVCVFRKIDNVLKELVGE
jgi:hypothetical protein